MAPKKAAAKTIKEPSEARTLPWTETMILSLLKLVQVTGAHLKSGKKSTTAWCSVAEKFFQQEELEPYRAKHYKVDAEGSADFRKLREFYNKTIKDVNADIATGNQSGKEGDLSAIYQTVKQLTMEFSDATETAAVIKQKKSDDAHLLAATEEVVLLEPQNGTKKRANENTAVKIRNLDGSITVDVERAAKKQASRPPTLENKFMQLIEHELNAVKHSPEALVDSVKQKMLMYVEQNKISTAQFLGSAFQITKKPPPEYLHAEFDSFGGLSTFMLIHSSRQLK